MEEQKKNFVDVNALYVNTKKDEKDRKASPEYWKGKEKALRTLTNSISFYHQQIRNIPGEKQGYLDDYAYIFKRCEELKMTIAKELKETSEVSEIPDVDQTLTI